MFKEEKNEFIYKISFIVWLNMVKMLNDGLISTGTRPQGCFFVFYDKSTLYLITSTHPALTAQRGFL